MNLPRYLSWGLFAALAGTGSSVQAFECLRTSLGQPVLWPERNISWWLDTALDAEPARTEIQASFDAWQVQGCSNLRFTLAGVEEGLTAGFTGSGLNRNVVVAVDNWLDDPSALAFTISTFVNDGRLLDADIELNEEEFDFGVLQPNAPCSGLVVDLRNTLTHEVGHFLGLDHPPNEPAFAANTMFATALPCDTNKRSLESDDVRGLCSLYPANGQAGSCFDTTQGLGDGDDGGCRGTRAPSLSLLVGLMGFWVVRLRHR